jgi:Cdc6-like AAA superfamily ATPase
LEFIQQNFEKEEILKGFKAGQFNVNDIFSFEDKLYGRESEIEMLRKSLKTSQEKNFVGMCMITGSSGIGKSVFFGFFHT